jgi:hypothetical protein
MRTLPSQVDFILMVIGLSDRDRDLSRSEGAESWVTTGSSYLSPPPPVVVCSMTLYETDLAIDEWHDPNALSIGSLGGVRWPQGVWEVISRRRGESFESCS